MSIESFIKRFANLTESYHFYNNTVELRFDKKNHKYLLVTEDGLEEQDGVTSIVKIIDKSPALMAWACKVMAKKLLDTVPKEEPNNPTTSISMGFIEFEKLVLDAKKAKDEHLEDAGAVGNLAHNWIEQYIKAVLVEETHFNPLPEEERAKNCCLAMLEWTKAHNVRFIKTECKIYSREHKFAGTMDGLALIDSCSDPKCCRNEFKDRLSVVDWKTSNALYIEYLFQTAAYKLAYEEETGVVIADRWVIRLGKDDAKFDPWHLEDHTTELDTRGFLLCLELSRLVAEVEDRVQEKADVERAERKAEKKAAREVKDASEKAEKARVKAEKQQARIEALRLACPASKKYQGKRRPTCKTNNGEPCITCTTKYYATNYPKTTKLSTFNGLTVLDILKK